MLCLPQGLTYKTVAMVIPWQFIQVGKHGSLFWLSLSLFPEGKGL